MEDSHNLNNEIKSLLIVKLIDAVSTMTKSLGKTKKRNKHLKKLVSKLEDKISAFILYDESCAINQIRVKELEEKMGN